MSKKISYLFFTLFPLIVFLFLSPVLHISSNILADDPSDNNWPMFRLDSNHTGYNSLETSIQPPLELKWNVDIGFGGASPIVVDGIVYFKAGGKIHALDSVTGEEEWVYAVSAGAHTSPAYSNGLILTGNPCSNCAFEAINTYTHTQSWFNTFSFGARDPVVINDIAYFGSDDQKVRAIDILSGNVLWTSPLLNSGILGIPTFENGKIYVGTANSKLYSIDAVNGSILWNFDIGASGHLIFSSPSVLNGTVYFGAGNAKVYAVDANTGLLKWASDLMTDSVWSSPALSKGNLYVQDLAGRIYALNAEDGSVVWYFQTAAAPSSSYSSSAVANGVVFVGSTDGKLYTLDATTGALLWSYQTDGPIISSPVVANGMVYVGSKDGKFYAFGPKGSGNLDVNYFSQKDSKWGDKQYDFMSLFIKDVGCALSSGAMVLDYQEIDKLPDGSGLDVLSLNNWLNENPDGWWRQGMTSWGAMTRLSKEMHDQDSEKYPIIEYKKLYPPDLSEIDRILTEEKTPLIFEIKSADSPSGVHFVVANGVITSGSEYSILDPYYEDKESVVLSDDELVSARYFYPTNSDLSYLFVNFDKDLQLMLTNSENERVGVEVGGVTTSEIQNSLISSQYPLLNDETQEAIGDEHWELSVEKPQSGDYEITLNSDDSGIYSFELYAYNSDGEAETFQEDVQIDTTNPVVFDLRYEHEGENTTLTQRKLVTFASLREDIWKMREEKHIKNNIVVGLLSLPVWFAERSYPKHMKVVEYFLNLFEWRLEKYHPRYIDDEAYELLSEDLQLLRESIF